MDRAGQDNRPRSRAPMAAVGAAFAAGVAGGHLLGGAWVWAGVALATAAAIIAATGVWRENGVGNRLPVGPEGASHKRLPTPFSSRVGIAGVMILIVMAGFWRETVEEKVVRADDVSRWLTDGAQATVRGTVAGRPQERTEALDLAGKWRRESTRFDVTVTGVRAGSDGWAAASGKVRVTINGRTEKIASGDEVEVSGKVRSPRGQRNPGGFDYAEQLGYEGISRLMALETDEAVQVTRHPGWNVYAVGALGDWAHKLPVFDTTKDRRRAGLMRCLILGERYAVDPEDEKHFRESGSMHLLAVSGLHVALILGMMWWVLRRTMLPEEWIAGVVIATALVYGVVAGMSAPVVRSVLTAVIFCGGVLIRRRTTFLNSLGAAALIIMAVSPGEMFTAGFQLSFLATLGIAMMTGPLTRRMKGWAGEKDELSEWWSGWNFRRSMNMGALGTTGGSVGALLLVLPMAAWQFRNISIVSPIFNIVLFPIFSVALLTGIAAVIIPTAGMAWLAWQAGDMLVWVADGIGRAPAAVIYVPKPEWWWLAIYYAVLAGVVFHQRLRMRIAWPLAGLGLMTAGTFAWVGMMSPGRDEVIVFDVGQGTSAAVVTRDGAALVYDAGSMDESRVGEAVVFPYLMDRGVRAVDVLVLSHSDIDHVNGVGSLLERMRVRRAVVSPSFAWTKTGREVMAMLGEAGVPVEYARRGAKIELGERIKVEVLNPGRDDEETRRAASPRTATGDTTEKMNVNNSSVALRVEMGKARVQFWGDVDANVFTKLARLERPAEVVLVPHHGSKKGPTIEGALGEGEKVIVSARESFASKGGLERLEGNGREVYATWECGAVRVRGESSGSGVRVERFIKAGEK